MRFTLTPSQEEAVSLLQSLLKRKNGFIRFRLGGYAGTGKTVTVTEAAARLQDQFDLYLVAPTNQAVQVLKSKTSGIRAQYMTIHRLLGFSMTIDEEKGEEVAAKVSQGSMRDNGRVPFVVLDEGSMTGKEFVPVLESLPAHLVIVGDPGQLPPVKESKSPLFDDDIFPVDEEYILEEILRQEDDSAVIDLATEVRLGNFTAIESMNGKGIIRNVSLQDVADIFAQDLDDPHHARICVYTNRTRQELNGYIRRKLGRKGLPVEGEFLLAMAPFFSAFEIDWDRKLTPVDPITQKRYWKERREAKEVAQAAYREGDPNARSLWAKYKQMDTQYHRYTLHTSEIVKVTSAAKDCMVEIDQDSLDYEYDFAPFENLAIPGMVLDIQVASDSTRIHQLVAMTDVTRQILADLRKQVAVEAQQIKQDRAGYGRMSREYRAFTWELKTLWRSYFTITRHFADLDYAYASTVHKAQGSGFKNVFLHREVGSAPHKARMLYTGITRTEESLYIL